MSDNERPDVDPGRAVLIIQDMQNDVMMEGGVWEDTGAPQHAKEQNVVENIRRLADGCRADGITARVERLTARQECMCECIATVVL